MEIAINGVLKLIPSQWYPISIIGGGGGGGGGYTVRRGEWETSLTRYWEGILRYIYMEQLQIIKRLKFHCN